MKTRKRILLGSALLLVIAAVVVIVVMRREEPLPNPNGFDDFAAAGGLVNSDSLEVEDKDPAALARFAVENQAVLERVRLGLSRTSQVPVKLDRNWRHAAMPDGMALRRAGVALEIIARQVESNAREDDAMIIRLDAARMGIECRRGGLLIDYMIGTATEEWSLKNISTHADNAPATACRRAIKVLMETEATSEPLAAAISLDQRWAVFGSGWWQSWDGMKEMAHSVFEKPAEFVSPTARERELARIRRDALLVLARRAFLLERGRRPAFDHELVPDFLPALPPAPVPVEPPRSGDSR